MTRGVAKEIEEFITHLEVFKNASTHTSRNYKNDLTQFQEFLSKEKMGKVGVDEIDKRVIRQFLASLHMGRIAKRTLLRKLASLRSFFKYCKREKKIGENPMEEIETPKLERSLPKSISYEEIERLFAQPDTHSYLGFRDRCIMELLYSSGLRISELAQLSRNDIDLKNRVVRVRGKGRKERLVPITSNAARWIKELLDHPERNCDGVGHRAQVDDDAIFLNKWGKRITVRSLDRNFAKYLLASAIPSTVTPHTIRHTIATHWLEKGMDLKTIQVILGHKNVSATTIYTRVSTKLKKEAYEKAHPLAAKGKEGKR